MKRISILFFAGIASCLFFSPARAAEQINQYDVELHIQDNGQVRVEEAIDYNFGAAQRHGIYRDIPFRYTTKAGTVSLHIGDIVVTDKQGTFIERTVSRVGDSQRIKIGDPNKTITGAHTYRISYTVDRAINFFDDHDELYWNAVGSGWEIPMSNVHVRVSLPDTVSLSDVDTACFVGVGGSKTTCDHTAGTLAFSFHQLSPHEGLTVVIGFPKGDIPEPTWRDRVFPFVQDNWVVGVPVFTLFCCLLLWYTRGRDPKGRGTVITQFGPPTGMTPGEVGAVYDEYVTHRDIVAEMIDLAAKGYMHITQTQQKGLLKKAEYLFEKKKDVDATIPQTQKILYEGLFREGKQQITSEELKHTFPTTFNTAEKNLFESVIAKKLFLKNPNRVRQVYAGIGIVVIVFVVQFALSLPIAVIASLVVSGIILIIFSRWMPARTSAGVLVQEHILGLHRYLTVAEKDRLAFHNAPDKNAEHFEALLPYAIALGVEKEWAEQFKDMAIAEPSWYTSAGNNFTPVLFASQLSDFTSTTMQHMAAAPSGKSGFGGGGFSGGGFGGGGGGSW